MEAHVYKHNIEKIIYFEESGYSQIKAYKDKLEWGTSFTHLFGYRGTTLEGTVNILEKTTNIFLNKVEERIKAVLSNPDLKNKIYARKLEKNIQKNILFLNGIFFLEDCYIKRYSEDAEHPGLSALHKFCVKSTDLTEKNIRSYNQILESFIVSQDPEFPQTVPYLIKSSKIRKTDFTLSNFSAYCLKYNPKLKISRADELANMGKDLVSKISSSKNPIYTSQDEKEADKEVAALIWYLMRNLISCNEITPDAGFITTSAANEIYIFLKSHPKMYKCNSCEDDPIVFHKRIDIIHQPLPGNKNRIFFELVENYDTLNCIYIKRGD